MFGLQLGLLRPLLYILQFPIFTEHRHARKLILADFSLIASSRSSSENRDSELLNGGAFSFRPSTTYALMQNHVHGKAVGTVSVRKDNYDSIKVASYTWNRPTPGTARPMT